MTYFLSVPATTDGMLWLVTAKEYVEKTGGKTVFDIRNGKTKLFIPEFDVLCVYKPDTRHEVWFMVGVALARGVQVYIFDPVNGFSKNPYATLCHTFHTLTLLDVMNGNM